MQTEIHKLIEVDNSLTSENLRGGGQGRRSGLIAAPDNSPDIELSSRSFGRDSGYGDLAPGV